MSERPAEQDVKKPGQTPKRAVGRGQTEQEREDKNAHQAPSGSNKTDTAGANAGNPAPAWQVKQNTGRKAERRPPGED